MTQEVWDTLDEGMRIVKNGITRTKSTSSIEQITNMHKISITIDVSKIDKNKIKPRTYNLKDGTQVTAQEYQIDVVPLKEPKVIKSTSNWVMKKSYFVAEHNEDREADTRFLGDGITFHGIDETLRDNYPTPESEGIDGDIPF